MIGNKLIASALALSLSMAVGVANADGTVIGNLKASSSAVINPGLAQQRINNEATPYIQGDVVSTVDTKSARVALSSGKGFVTVAPNSIIAVSGVAPFQVEIQQGGVQVEASQGESVQLVTKAGLYELKSEFSISAVAVFENDQLAVVSKGGELVIESQSGDAVTKVSANDAFVVGVEQPAKTVDVQLLGFGSTTSTLLTVAAVVAGGVIVDEIANDDDDGSPSR